MTRVSAACTNYTITVPLGSLFTKVKLKSRRFVKYSGMHTLNRVLNVKYFPGAIIGYPTTPDL